MVLEEQYHWLLMYVFVKLRQCNKFTCVRCKKPCTIETKNSLSLIQLLQMNPVFSFSPRAIGVKCRSKVCSHEFVCTRLRLKILDVMFELEDSFHKCLLKK